jgi:hypothetical protein
MPSCAAAGAWVRWVLVPSFLDNLTIILASTLLCLQFTQQIFGAILRSGWCLGAVGFGALFP